MRNCPQVQNAIRRHWSSDNTGSGYGLLQSGNRPLTWLTQLILTQIYVTIWHHQATSIMRVYFQLKEFLWPKWLLKSFWSKKFLELKFNSSTPEGRAVLVTRELDLSLLCRIWLFGRHLVSLAKIAEVWPPFFLATETPDIALEYTSREIWSE